MTFLELPYMSVEEFDYANIAKEIETDEADIIWIALGAPKQEYFMDRLKPHLKRGVMIAVGAVFKFYSGVEARRAQSGSSNGTWSSCTEYSENPRSN